MAVWHRLLVGYDLPQTHALGGMLIEKEKTKKLSVLKILCQPEGQPERSWLRPQPAETLTSKNATSVEASPVSVMQYLWVSSYPVPVSRNYS